jgi:hypothetical protein
MRYRIHSCSSGRGNENPPALFAICPGNPIVCGIRARASRVGFFWADIAFTTPLFLEPELVDFFVGILT